MKNLFTLFAGLVLITNCASIGSVVEGTKEFTTGVVDGAVKGTSTVVSAVAIREVARNPARGNNNL